MVGILQVLSLVAALLLTSTQASGANFFDVAECGKAKNCTRRPEGCQSEESCEYLFSYKDGENNVVTMELYTKRKDPSVGYIAVGFSTDQTMGDDAVTACTIDGDRVKVHLSKNDGKANVPHGDKPPEEETVQLEDSRVDDGSLYCKFTQRSHAGSKDLMQPDLTSQPLFFLLARGPAKGGKLAPHSFDESGADFPSVSPMALRLMTSAESAQPHFTFSQRGAAEAPKGSNPSVSGSLNLSGPTKITLVKIHAFFMVTAWFGFVAVAIYTARYMRPVWSDSNLCGTKFWFALHRGLNIAAVVLIVLACICVFLARDLNWTGPWFTRTADENLSWGRIHSLIGVLAVILAISQPLNSLLRCVPDHPKRYKFNLTHRSIGLVAFGLAVAAVFIAVWKFARYWASPVLALILLAIFVVVALLLIAASEINRSRRSVEQGRVNAIALHEKNKPRGASSTPSDSYYLQTHTRSKLHFLYHTKVLYMLAVMACLSVALLYAILIWAH